MGFESLMWSIPFVGIILSMSFLPLLFPKFWHGYSSYVPFFWLFVYLAFLIGHFDVAFVSEKVIDPLVADYIPFIILISSLYIVSGGVFIEFPRWSGPCFNVALLFSGSMLAGWIGTTGASMLLIRPFLRANQYRKYKTHLMVFFIFLISNIGGVATPLGDPPLFIGFLKGVDFFWFIRNLYKVLLSTVLILCALFFIIDSILYRLDEKQNTKNEEPKNCVVINGIANIFLLVLICSIVIACNFEGSFFCYGEEIKYSSLLRNTLLILVSLISIKTTPRFIREQNNYSIDAITEIATLFFGIFITVVPIIHMLQHGEDGAFKTIFEWIAPNSEFIASRCFWISGLLSSVLDNAPTFLIFFHLTSGDANILMTVKENILSAISISTVFMGALTYIGNAPNLMVKSVSEKYGVNAPSFVGYMFWSYGILMPIFYIISCLL